MDDMLTDNLQRSPLLPQPAEHTAERPWLSILLPVYNVADYLGPCINSILSQLPATGVEILLLDDCSTDGSRAICEEIGSAHGQVRLLRHAHNRGLSAARNSLLEAARGRYVWFVDSDDEMLPGAITQLRAIIERHAPGIVLCDYRKQGQAWAGFIGPQHGFSADREALVAGVFASRRMYAWCRVSLRELWGADLRFPLGRSFEDIMTTPWLCLRAQSFYYARQPWISYRVRAGSIMASVKRARGPSFDQRRHDDLANSLSGFLADAEVALPGMSARTRHYIGRFCAREFTKISWRLLRARFRNTSWNALCAQLLRYRAIMEGASPVPFAQMATRYLLRGKPGRWLELGFPLLLTRSWMAESLPQADAPGRDPQAYPRQSPHGHPSALRR